MSQQLKQKCPAFSSGCPYANLKVKEDGTVDAPKGHGHGGGSKGIDLSDVKTFQSLKDKCPAFADGCPFANKTPNEIKGLLDTVPKDHVQCPVEPGALSQLVSLCSDGVPLMESLLKHRLDLFAMEAEEKKRQKVELAKIIKEGTKSSHRAAEREPFILQVFQSKVDRDTYRRFVLALYQVYCTLEQELTKHKSHKVLSLLYFPDHLHRKHSLEIDMEYFYGKDWRTVAKAGPLGPCTENYCTRIKQLSVSNPTLLVAHSYTRYLGDLSGGQILRKKLLRSPLFADVKNPLEKEHQPGVAFYEFPNIKDSGKFKDEYRAVLNRLPVSSEEADAIVAEANTAFGLNINVFREVDDLSRKEAGKTVEAPATKSDNGTLREIFGIIIAFLTIAVAVMWVKVFNSDKSVGRFTG